MAQLGEYFDHTTVEPRDNLDPVPAGTYTAEITESDVVQNKKKNGMVAKFTLKITEGPYEGRQIWQSINFRHENETAQKIGQQQLAELCAACGLRGPLEDTDYLHGIPVKIRVVVEPDKTGQYGPRNAVKKFESVTAPEQQTRRAPIVRNNTAVAMPHQTAAATAPAAGRATVPWAR